MVATTRGASPNERRRSTPPARSGPMPETTWRDTNCSTTWSTRTCAWTPASALAWATRPAWFAERQREYPIFLRKGEGESEYHAVALLGFDASENLFLDGDRWNANYLPGAVVRGPFSIGFRDPVPGGSLEPEPVVHVDM